MTATERGAYRRKSGVVFDAGQQPISRWSGFLNELGPFRHFLASTLSCAGSSSASSVLCVCLRFPHSFIHWICLHPACRLRCAFCSAISQYFFSSGNRSVVLASPARAAGLLPTLLLSLQSEPFYAAAVFLSIMRPQRAWQEYRWPFFPLLRVRITVFVLVPGVFPLRNPTPARALGRTPVDFFIIRF